MLFILSQSRTNHLTSLPAEIAFDCMKAAYDAGINVSQRQSQPLSVFTV
jgi:hypothetical protein